MAHKNRWPLFMLLVVMSCTVSGQHPKTARCNNPEFDKKVDSYLSYTVPVIGVKEAQRLVSGVVFLDAREKKEFDVSHIPGAVWVGYDDFSLSRVATVPKGSQLIVYCSVGYRSEKIAEKLMKAGYTRVKNLYGSIFEWVNAGFPLEDTSRKTVKKIHTYNKDWSRWVTVSGYQKIY